ncbi:MAG: nicotinate-nucleotide adenylyltransferase [bacterium]|nr:nicotinate-nucleotide adenylyltransferase [bacterium]
MIIQKSKVKSQKLKPNAGNIRRIGIFGGTFNPIHNGHLLIAEEARVSLKLDKVIFIPSANPPHKEVSDLVSGRHRLKMAGAAIKNNPFFSVSDIELKRGGRSYSIETIKTLKEIYRKGTKFFFIMGADSILEFMTWKNWEDLLKLCNFAVYPRPGYKINLDVLKSRMKKKLLAKSLVKNIIFFQTRVFDVSSTEVREKIKKGESVKYLVPEGVIGYINKSKLYK